MHALPAFWLAVGAANGPTDKNLLVLLSLLLSLLMLS